MPHTHRDTRVWVRVAAGEVIIVADTTNEAAAGGGAVELARHPLLGSGQASILDEHYPPRRSDPLAKEPKASSGAEAEFLAIGDGAKAWLVEAAATGARGIDARMADAVAAAKVADPARVDEALGLAAVANRFAAGDLESILAARQGEPRRADPGHLLQRGTAAWSQLGNQPGGEPR